MIDKIKQSAEWAEFHKAKILRSYPKWPNEAMLKLLFGNYTEHPIDISPAWKVLDVGCGFGNNLIPFADLGCEIHGVEIDPEIVNLTTKVLSNKGFESTISFGTNRKIPYDSNTFDLLLSVNTIHYEGHAGSISLAFQEFQRVLKPGEVLYLSTVAPEHTIFTRARSLGNHQYEVQNFDFRDGEKFYFFDSGDLLREFLSKEFSIIEIGQVTEKLMALPLDFYVAVAHV